MTSNPKFAIVLCAVLVAGPAIGQGSKSVPALIVNDANNPVPVNVLRGAAVTICGESQTGNPTKLLYQVPGDKRLEIEFASVKASRFLETTESLFVFVSTTVQGTEGQFLVGGIQGQRPFASSTVVKIYADPGTLVTTSQGSSSSSPFPNGSVCLSGRLLPL